MRRANIHCGAKCMRAWTGCRCVWWRYCCCGVSNSEHPVGRQDSGERRSNTFWWRGDAILNPFTIAVAVHARMTMAGVLATQWICHRRYYIINMCVFGCETWQIRMILCARLARCILEHALPHSVPSSRTPVSRPFVLSSSRVCVSLIVFFCNNVTYFSQQIFFGTQ